MTTQDYSDKSSNYFSRIRMDILPLLPGAPIGRILEIGCGNGATLTYLKEAGRVKVVEGIELLPSVAAQASDNIDKLYVGAAEHFLDTLTAESYDVVLCLDVLEHMIDPWEMVLKIERLLKPGGAIIASIPNVRTLKVIWSLAIRGNFTYASQGIMDRTHLRFFTRTSALELLSRDKLRVDRWKRTPMAPWSKSQIFNTLSLGLFRDLLTEQFLIRANKQI